MRRVIAVGAIVLAGIGGLVACGDDDDESQATAEQNLCGSLSTFSAAVVNLQGLDVQTASKDDYEAAAQGIADAWNSVRQDAKDVADADADALDAAREDLESAVDELPEDVPVASAIAGLEPQVDGVAQAWREIFDRLDCASGTTQDESLQ